MSWMVALDGDNDLMPRIFCAVCEQPVALNDYFAFQALTVDSPAQSVIPCHRACLQGRARQLLGTTHVVFWTIRDYLRQFSTTQMAGQAVLEEDKYNHYWRRANSAAEHHLPGVLRPDRA
jgi:hypothetical protein